MQTDRLVEYMIASGVCPKYIVQVDLQSHKDDYKGQYYRPWKSNSILSMYILLILQVQKALPEDAAKVV